MNPKHFLQDIEDARLSAAIRAAEEGSTADIVILISQKKIPDALQAAEIVFLNLKLEKAASQNSLLIFVAPLSQTYAVVGGPALHNKVGQDWWNELATLLGSHFKDLRFGEGLIAALEKAGHAVKIHFPATGSLDRSGQHDLLGD